MDEESAWRSREVRIAQQESAAARRERIRDYESLDFDGPPAPRKPVTKETVIEQHPDHRQHG